MSISYQAWAIKKLKEMIPCTDVLQIHKYLVHMYQDKCKNNVSWIKSAIKGIMCREVKVL